jgi:hypothetical protein
VTTSNHLKKSEVGDVRPSQAMTTFGVGSLVDLPNLSVLVMGLDDWQSNLAVEIAEERLLDSAREILGPQVAKLLTPPRAPETTGPAPTWFDESRQIGIPVAPFPRWLVCSKCRLLAPISSGLFEPKVSPYRPDRTSYVHNCSTQGKSPLAVPARFLATCERGHLDDFPWMDFVHQGDATCKGPLCLYEVGASGEALDVEVRCKGCGKSRRMGQAFGLNNRKVMPACRGRRPHLRDFDPDGCDQEHMKPALQGASNLWFPMLIVALSIPLAKDELGLLVEENWAVLEKAASPEILSAFRAIGQLKDFGKYTDAAVWDAVRKRRLDGSASRKVSHDLKSPEWRVFTNPGQVKESRDFKLRAVAPPPDFTRFFEKIVLVEKLREVKALVGFTRLASPRDFDSPTEMPKSQRAPISRTSPTWVPASETRGEGVFFQFSETAVSEWVAKNAAFEQEFRRGHEVWRASKNLDPAHGYPGIRYVLLHTFAHAMIRQLSIECGYTTASLTERIYSRNPTDADPMAMAGVLIYTAASDSEGTLGGLCALGAPDKLGRHIERALEKMSLCASDPLCSEHVVGRDDKLHGAACHACMFLPETSCERGNKYLDRSALVPTVEPRNVAFFR